MNSYYLHLSILWLCFFGGQCLFLLKRAGSAIRNPGTAVHTRRQYFALNWDTILIRAAIEGVFIFYPFHKFSLEQIVGFFGWNLSSTVLANLSTAADSLVGYFAIGYASDSVLDGLSMSQKLPQFLRDWIHENVPTPAQVALAAQQGVVEAQQKQVQVSIDAQKDVVVAQQKQADVQQQQSEKKP
jgi:hypothetical protein